MRYNKRDNPISVLSLIATVLLPCYAKPVSPRWDDTHTVHAWKRVPENWVNLGHPAADTTIKLYIALRPHQESSLIDALYEVSDPNHPRHVLLVSPLFPMYSPVLSRDCRYGAHLTKEQVAGLVAPHPNTLELVRSWLIYHRIPFSPFSMTHGGNTLTLTDVPIIQANKLLGASYQIYKHVETNETVVRTIGYALPTALHNHVWTVAPTTRFDSLRVRGQAPRKRSQAAEKQAREVSRVSARALPNRYDGTTSPDFLHWLYKSWSYVPTATWQNMLAVVGYLWDSPSPTDLQAFMQKYRSDGVDGTFRLVTVNYGIYNPSDPNSEANLDLQYAQGMAYPTPLVFYSTGRGPQGTDDWYLSWLNSVLDLLLLPQTISTSYVSKESSYSRQEAAYLCYLYAQLGARGVSLLFATGNFGVGQGNCARGDGSIRFVPNFPASCTCGILLSGCRKYSSTGTVCSSHTHAFAGPWVTAVGGTTSFLPEWAASFSGGGFSDYFQRPSYQQQAAASYFDYLGNQYNGLYKCVHSLSWPDPRPL